LASNNITPYKIETNYYAEGIQGSNKGKISIDRVHSRKFKYPSKFKKSHFWESMSSVFINGFSSALNKICL
jgi:hypothetical protein